MLSSNNPMQFNYLESILPLVDPSVIGESLLLLLLFEQLNEQAFNLWKKSLDNLSLQDVTPQS